MTINQPRRSPVEITNPNAVYVDSQSRGELRHALAVLLAHERAGKLSAWGLADALIAGPLAPLLAKLRAVETDTEPDPFTPGTAVTVYELPGGYLVTPAETPSVKPRKRTHDH